MVRLWMILAVLVLLGCGSRRKQVHQEREHTEYTAAAQIQEQQAVQKQQEQNTLVTVDESGDTLAEIYNLEGTFNPDGSFTGRADSAKVRSTARRSQAISQASTSSQDSTSTSSSQQEEREVRETEKEDTNLVVRRSVPWYVWAGIIVLVAFALFFGTPLKRILKPFKSTKK